MKSNQPNEIKQPKQRSETAKVADELVRYSAPVTHLLSELEALVMNGGTQDPKELEQLVSDISKTSPPLAHLLVNLSLSNI